MGLELCHAGLELCHAGLELCHAGLELCHAGLELLQLQKKKTERPTAVSRNCGVWDLSELVVFETKFCLYL